jgi:SAM-dependent methyltransferase
VSYDDVEEARLYDAQNPWGPSDDFYLGLVMAADAVLDVGCGTGTLLARARRDGHRGRLVGLDPGAGMLAVAREKRADVEWVAAGTYAAEFDLVTMTGHAFQELRTDAEVAGTLRTMRAALRPGGRVAFETRDPTAREWEQWDGASFDVEHAGATVRTSYAVHSVAGDLVSFTETLDGGPWRGKAGRSTLRFLDAAALDRFLADAGLRVEERYGSFRREATGPEIITIAAR